MNAFLGYVYSGPLGNLLRIGIVIAIGVAPVAHDFGYMHRRRWLFLWAAVYGARETLVWWLGGEARLNLTKRIARINRDLGGAIDALARRVVPPGSLKKPAWLTEEQSHNACMSLLARILEFTLNEYPSVEPSDVRVTLAVPLHAPGMTQPTSLRIWCYDRPHDDSHWTEFPLPAHKGELPYAGAPDAFISNEVRIVPDIRTVLGIPGVENRRYRSIVSVPVTAGGPSGRPCAVVNIDAAAENFFSEDAVWERILPLATPILSSISLVLRLRMPGVPYTFGN